MKKNSTNATAGHRCIPLARNRQWRNKDAQILSAAERVFMDGGYAGASMDAIALEAGVSKQTLYHHHGCKESLFAAIVDSRVDCLLMSLETDDLNARPPRQALRTLGIAFLETAVSPSSIALHRAVVTEAPRRSDLGCMVYERGPARAVRVLAAYLKARTRDGQLDVRDPERAAEQFYGMTLGHLQLCALLCVESKTEREELEPIVDAAVDVFLKAHTPAPSNGA